MYFYTFVKCQMSNEHLQSVSIRSLYAEVAIYAPLRNSQHLLSLNK